MKSCNTAAGFGNLIDQRAHYDRVINSEERNRPSEVQLQNIEYGTKHKVKSIATLLGRFIQEYLPDHQYFEDSCTSIAFQNIPYCLVVSPDGSLRETDTEPTTILEIKCQTHNKYKTDVFFIKYCITIYHSFVVK